jgi:hypothetical protein
MTNPFLVYIDSNIISEMSFDEMMQFKLKFGLRTPNRHEIDPYKDTQYGFLPYVFECADTKLKLEFILKYGNFK